MSGSDILLDTNILLYFLNGDKEVQKFFVDYNPIVSFITELEILSSPELTQTEKSNIEDLLSQIKVLKYSDRYKQAILDIRTAKKLKLPDSIIAGTAVAEGIPLVSADKAFNNISVLNLFFYNATGI